MPVDTSCLLMENLFCERKSLIISSFRFNCQLNSGKVSGNNKTQYTYEYLAQLLKDKKQLEAFPNVFHHLDRLAEEGFDLNYI